MGQGWQGVAVRRAAMLLQTQPSRLARGAAGNHLATFVAARLHNAQRWAADAAEQHHSVETALPACLSVEDGTVVES